METVLITGGTGLIGAALTRELTAKGYKVIILSRGKHADIGGRKSSVTYARWDVEAGTIDKEAVKKADYIVHLAGANVAESRWTQKRKKEIADSRTKSAALLVNALKEIPNHVKAVVSASGIGWYGADRPVADPEPFIETNPADSDFLGQTCKLWESSIDPVAGLGKRLVKIRTGIVLSNRDGAYAAFKKPLKMGVATVLGRGNQVVSWIHINDIVGLYIYALENEKLQGVYNAVAPLPVTNKQLIETIAKTRNKFYMQLHVPETALKLILGEMSVEILKSATVSSKKAEQAGYRFLFPSIESAVHNLEAKR